MTFEEVLRSVCWNEVALALRQDYGLTVEALPACEKVFWELCALEPSREVPGIRLVIQQTSLGAAAAEPFTEVFGAGADPGQESQNEATGFSLSLMCWEDWLAMPLDQHSVSSFSPARIVSHCLMDLTFYGFDQTSVAAAREELRRIGDDEN